MQRDEASSNSVHSTSTQLALPDLVFGQRMAVKESGNILPQQALADIIDVGGVQGTLALPRLGCNTCIAAGDAVGGLLGGRQARARV